MGKFKAKGTYIFVKKFAQWGIQHETGGKVEVKVMGPARVSIISSLALVALVPECLKGFRSCKYNSAMCVRSIFTLNQNWEFTTDFFVPGLMRLSPGLVVMTSHQARQICLLQEDSFPVWYVPGGRN